ncbi:MAG: DUF1003 domain-containing protein, partial [Bacteroidales bacterium]
MKTFRSDVSNTEFPITEKISAKSIRHSILDVIQKDHPQFSHESNLSKSEFNFYKEKALSEYLTKEVGKLTDAEKTVVSSINNHEIISDNIDDQENQQLTVGQRIADKVASFGGSWTFIIAFGLFILFWILVNVYWLMNKGFDPYPFILLNLILSCLAAIQAPVIMMSQNRQEEKDRERSKNDYMVNLKSELEIRILHEKMDHLLSHQWERLAHIQEIQLDLLSEM